MTIQDMQKELDLLVSDIPADSAGLTPEVLAEIDAMRQTAENLLEAFRVLQLDF